MTTAIEVEGKDAAHEDAGAKLRELFDVHGGTVFGLCAVLLGDRTEAEDATQQAFLSAYESLLRGAVPWSPLAWLAAIARNECRDRLRAQARRTFVPATEQEPAGAAVEEIASLNAEFLALRQALRELPERQREAILLYELCGLSYGEIAGTLNMSHAAVETLLFRTRRKLRNRVGVLTLAPGVLVVPLAVGEGLAHAVPGFGAAGQASAAVASAVAGGAAGGTAGGGTFAGVALVKLAAVPLIGKVAAVAVTAGVTATMIVGVPGGGPPAAERAGAGGPTPTMGAAAEGFEPLLVPDDRTTDPGSAPWLEGPAPPSSGAADAVPQNEDPDALNAGEVDPAAAGALIAGRSAEPADETTGTGAEAPAGPAEEAPLAEDGDPPAPVREATEPPADDAPADEPDPGPDEGSPGEPSSGGGGGGGGSGDDDEHDPPGGGDGSGPSAGGGGDDEDPPPDDGDPPPGGGDGDPPPSGGDGDPPPSGGDSDPPPSGGDGDPPPGDGDGDPPSGDGDGDPPPSGGDGDPPPGDGDGDPPPGDGDGDPPPGDGEGDPPSGDGDPPPSGGDGDFPPGGGDSDPPPDGGDPPDDDGDDSGGDDEGDCWRRFLAWLAALIANARQ